ncbi:unnamed protein product [Lactuca virosa]|uniref:Uncharacterized protein n=1 Tax=Lactuca virosa TaxID=75947 RepID=A0AAU9MWN5_9ASTR|nr:unnamed protein product [Lactuca virosa]
MGHEGDGGDEPPHPFGGDFGVHQIDAVPPRRRGMTVNKKMHRLYEANGRQPLKIIFDKNTFVPIGVLVYTFESYCFKLLETFRYMMTQQRGETMDSDPAFDEYKCRVWKIIALVFVHIMLV